MSTLNTTNLKNPSSGSNNIVLATDGSATIATLSSTTITGTTIQGTIKSGTAVASTSGTSIDFTSIPSWVKRITVMFSGVSTSGTSLPLIQLGTSAGVTSTGYTSTGLETSSTGTNGNNSTAGFVIRSNTNTFTLSGLIAILNVTGNAWTASHTLKADTSKILSGAGDVTLSATLDRVRITTVNGTDTFDAGTINILYEG
jgi:hypothetical protein